MSELLITYFIVGAITATIFCIYGHKELDGTKEYFSFWVVVWILTCFLYAPFAIYLLVSERR